MSTLTKWTARMTCASLFLAFTVILLGATTRLKDAGLGCPDWPGCYGHLIVPHLPLAPSFASQTLHAYKAWTEMIHRYAAALLVIFSFTSVGLLLRSKPQPTVLLKIAFAILCLLVVQALLGKWTVTLHLYPLVVMSHLLAGLTLLSLLWMLLLYLIPVFTNTPTVQEKKLRPLARCALLLIVLQISLGGWTSSNYAAFVCTDFPRCQGTWWPAMDFNEGFHVGTDLNKNFAGGLLSTEGRTAIQMSHRIGALTATLVLMLLIRKLKNSTNATLRSLSMLLLFFLTLQISLGIFNVIWLLPLPIAIAHNAVAAFLLLTLITLNAYLGLQPTP